MRVVDRDRLILYTVSLLACRAQVDRISLEPRADMQVGELPRRHLFSACLAQSAVAPVANLSNPLLNLASPGAGVIS